MNVELKLENPNNVLFYIINKISGATNFLFKIPRDCLILFQNVYLKIQHKNYPEVYYYKMLCFNVIVLCAKLYNPEGRTTSDLLISVSAMLEQCLVQGKIQ